MIILEQPINPDEIQFTLHCIVLFCITIVIILLMGIGSYKYLVRASNKRKEGKISEGTLFLKAFLAALVIPAISLGSMCLISTYAYKVPGLNHFSEPQYKPGDVFFSKHFFTDIYHDEINAAIADKLSSYDIPECSIDKEKKSILCPNGDYVEKIAAIRDSKTYTLTPHLDYNADTSTVTLNVDIEEGYQE